VELAGAGLLLGRQLAALAPALEELAQLFALRLRALAQAVAQRAELLALGVGEVELAEGTQAVAAPPVALAALALHAFVPTPAALPVLRRGLRLLRRGAHGQRRHEAERDARTLQKLLHVVKTPSGKVC
jgi:hypothetical protein